MSYRPVDDPFGHSAFSAQDRRDAAERASAERAAVRQSRIDQQSSPQLSAMQRVEHWERFHGLRMPTNPQHPLLSVIAADTALAMEDIHAEQMRRSVVTARA